MCGSGAQTRGIWVRDTALGDIDPEVIVEAIGATGRSQGQQVQ